MDSFDAFLKSLRADQDRLRDEMQPYESGGYRLLRRSPTGELQDITDQRIAQIRREIDSIESAIKFAILQQEMRRA